MVNDLNTSCLQQTDFLNNTSQKYNKFAEAQKDIVKGTINWRLWTTMAISEVKRRYRRTLLGPFWTTLSIALHIGSMGVVFAYLWNVNVKTFLPYFASGYICWTFISTIVTEGSLVFIVSDSLMKQIPLCYSTFPWLLIFRNILILWHHLIFYAVIIFVMKVPVNANFIFFIPGIFLVAATGFWLSFIIGLICARYRDLLQVVGTCLQILMFVTPIFWVPAQMNGIRSSLLVSFNPLHHYINIIRAPLLGNAPELINWIVTICLTLILAIISFYNFAIHKRKIIFWL